MKTEELKILLALEPIWTVGINGTEFLPLRSSEIELRETAIHFGKYVRQITAIEWLRPNVVRVHARQKFRSETDVFTFYPGERLPSAVDIRRRRRAFQRDIARALSAERLILHSDKQHGIGGAYPRFLTRVKAAIAVDPDEQTAVINGIMRAAILWSPLVRRPLSVIIPELRRATVVTRLAGLPDLRNSFEWLQWDGDGLAPMNFDAPEPETRIQQNVPVASSPEIDRICALAPGVVQVVPDIAGKATSVRLRGIEIAHFAEHETTFPLGLPLEKVVAELWDKRRYGSGHALARAHEERWLESNLICEIKTVLPSVNADHVYPQVPSFIGIERNIVDLLTVTEEGRLVVIEVKASADPDLPFQAFDYWQAVERHRRAGDFQTYGYFSGVRIQDEPALLVLVAPLLAFHKTFDRLISLLPPSVPLMQVGIHHAWKREIKILRRKGLLG